MERGCLEPHGFEIGCHDVVEYYKRRYPSSFNDTGSSSNEGEPHYTEEEGVLCYCDTDKCNGNKIGKIGDKIGGNENENLKDGENGNKTTAGSALQTSDSHNLMMIGVLAMATLITLSAGNDE